MLPADLALMVPYSGISGAPSSQSNAVAVHHHPLAPLGTFAQALQLAFQHHILVAEHALSTIIELFVFLHAASALPCRFVRRASSIYYLQLAHFDLDHQNCHNFPDGAFAGLLGVVSHQLVELQIDSCPTMFKVGAWGALRCVVHRLQSPAGTTFEFSRCPTCHDCPSQIDLQQGQCSPAEALSAGCCGQHSCVRGSMRVSAVGMQCLTVPSLGLICT